MRDVITNILDPTQIFNGEQPSKLASNPSCGTITYQNQPDEISHSHLRDLVRCLNSEQHFAYDIVLTWCRKLIKNTNTLKPRQVKPIHLFVTGGGGAGKSHLIKHCCKNFQASSIQSYIINCFVAQPVMQQ